MPDFSTQEYSIDLLIAKILTDDRQYDISKLIAAYQYAAEHHEGQVRSSGEPYIIHPLAVADILLDLGLDTDTLCAALLHDVVEDTDATRDDVQKRFGQDVALLVDGVTKLARASSNYSKEQAQSDNVMKILLAMSQDIRVMIIKLADRLHNMRTLQYRPSVKRKRTAQETLTVYAPIAHRLGMTGIQEALEDWAFYYLDPYAYEDIERLLNIRKEERDAFIQRIKQQIADRCKEMPFQTPPQIDGRVKSLYGIYKKLYINQKNIEEIYDKYALRVIVSNINECYSVLGLVHDMFSPIPNRFKDYIANPKSNGYQSLHTSLLCKEGIPFEVQIRTWEMHATAEYGVAAHWKYKERIRNTSRSDSRLEWVRQVLENQQNSDDPEELVNAIKTDIAPEEITVLTPKGDPITLPLGSTVFDFAYHIHADVGHRTTGANVDGQIVPLDYRLSTGEVCEILTTKDPNKGPSRNWLEIVYTTDARTKIRNWFRRERKAENIATGKERLERELKRQHLNLTQEQLFSIVMENLRLQNCNSLDDFYAAVGYGGVTLTKIIPKLWEFYMKRFAPQGEVPAAQEPVIEKTPRKPGREKHTSNVIVDGEKNCMVKFARCCSPMPGDEIVGFTTLGHGISIHTKQCKKYQDAVQSNNPQEMSRWIRVEWAADAVATDIQAGIEVLTIHRVGVLNDITNVLTEARVPVSNFNYHILKNGNAMVTATVTVSSKGQLNTILTRLAALRDVLSADRAMQ